MVKDRSAEDIITEEEYTVRMVKARSTQPEDDSPGDSEMDAGAEFDMGLEYLPDDGNDPDLPDEEFLLESEVDKKLNDEKFQKQLKEIPESAKAISSELPAPWMDRDSNSSTN